MQEYPLTHIAIIMDGNRRWAKAHGLSPLDGHKHVADSILEPLIDRAADHGIKYLTLWAWSTENWRRDPQEVKGIMILFRRVLEEHWQKLHKNGVCVRMIGDSEKFPQDIQDSLSRVIELTAKNTKLTLIFALNYGGRDEIIRGIGKIPDLSKLNSELFSECLDTKGIPDPDMIVRTGGEQRLSGFLLWQSQYSELYFPQWPMPEFTPERLDEVVTEYVHRRRRFGV